MPYTMQPAGAAAHVRRRAARVAEGVRRRPRRDERRRCARAPSPTRRARSRAYLRRLEAMLGDGRPFLLGEAAPASPTSRSRTRCGSCAARRRSRRVLDACPRVRAWFERIAAFGHGESTTMASAEAIDVAAAATRPRSRQSVEHRPGLRAPATRSRSRRPTTRTTRSPGRSSASTPHEVVVERSDPRAGTRARAFPAHRLPDQGGQEGTP